LQEQQHDLMAKSVAAFEINLIEIFDEPQFASYNFGQFNE
jgi:hypothetical protein